ncbi:hypothetical protein SADUNF_Sadunf10G0142300 [Salix dunnii]|uniref:Uncharacterized protein n=1 Tax=Salix dunnii TaxID=1413687 RepID=A0A835MR43_9ROSI|nr:hypothetical protein SADUNF_Sadunf10G0142300 [Salix dunnii]
MESWNLLFFSSDIEFSRLGLLQQSVLYCSARFMFRKAGDVGIQDRFSSVNYFDKFVVHTDMQLLRGDLIVPPNGDLAWSEVPCPIAEPARVGSLLSEMHYFSSSKWTLASGSTACSYPARY